MAKEDRLRLIKDLQGKRKSLVLCYVTSDRQGLSFQIGGDTPRLFFDHLKHLESKVPRLDLFLYSAGGDTSVPWRIVSLLREFCEEFNVLIPYRAYSAATLLSLGADKIVMGRKGELGPIDPSVANDFNPTDPNTKQKISISVEDVDSYIDLVKEKIGIVHQPQVGAALGALTSQVHPLALGNVNRQTQFIRMIASKMQKSHIHPPIDSKIDEVVKNLVEKIYFHGHGINRNEAKDLGLEIDFASGDLEKTLWSLYLEYETSLQLGSLFNPQDILTGVAEENQILENVEGAFIESERLSHSFRCSVNLATKRQTPQNVNITANLPIPADVAQGTVNQEFLRQLQMAVQQLVLQQLRAQSPIIGYEARLSNLRWEKDDWALPIQAQSSQS